MLSPSRRASLYGRTLTCGRATGFYIYVLTVRLLCDKEATPALHHIARTNAYQYLCHSWKDSPSSSNQQSLAHLRGQATQGSESDAAAPFNLVEQNDDFGQN